MSFVNRRIRYIYEERPPGFDRILNAGRVPTVGPLLFTIQIDLGELPLVSPLGHIR